MSKRIPWEKDVPVGEICFPDGRTILGVQRQIREFEGDVLTTYSNGEKLIIEKLRARSGKEIGTLTANFLFTEPGDPDARAHVYAEDEDNKQLGIKITPDNGVTKLAFTEALLTDLLERRLIKDSHDLVPPALLTETGRRFKLNP